MVKEDYYTLKEVLTELRREIKDLKKKIMANTERIVEIDSRLKVYRDAEPEDFKVFSPRNAEAVHREEIQQIKKEREALEEQNREWNQRKATLGKYAGKLEKVLKSRDENSCLERETADSLQSSSIEALEHLVHKIEQSSSLIPKNPVQARQDLAVIGRNLQETVDKIRDTVWII